MKPQPKTVRVWAWVFSWRKKTVRNGRASVSFHNARDSARYWLDVHQKDGVACGPVTRVSVEVPAPWTSTKLVRKPTVERVGKR